MDKEKAVATAPAPTGGAAPQAAASGQAPRPAKAERSSFSRFLLGIGLLFLLAAKIPFLMGARSPIGLLIIAFGLWEAWKINQRTELAISGPFQVGAAPAATPAGS